MNFIYTLFDKSILRLLSFLLAIICLLIAFLYTQVFVTFDKPFYIIVLILLNWYCVLILLVHGLFFKLNSTFFKSLFSPLTGYLLTILFIILFFINYTK